MSEIRATTISDAAGTGPITLTKQSAAKATITFNGASNTISESNNVSSLTDLGTGSFRPTFASGMSSATYHVTNFVCGGDDRRMASAARDNVVSSYWHIVTRSSVPADNNALVDENKSIGVIHGDLA